MPSIQFFLPTSFSLVIQTEMPFINKAYTKNWGRFIKKYWVGSCFFFGFPAPHWSGKRWKYRLDWTQRVWSRMRRRRSRENTVSFERNHSLIYYFLFPSLGVFYSISADKNRRKIFSRFSDYRVELMLYAEVCRSLCVCNLLVKM